VLAPDTVGGVRLAALFLIAAHAHFQGEGRGLMIATIGTAALVAGAAIRGGFPVDSGVHAFYEAVFVLSALATAVVVGLLRTTESASRLRARGLSRRTMQAESEVRRRVAESIHDGPVQELTALRYGLTRARNRVRRGQAEEAEGLLAELEDELASGITGLRRLMTELRPAVLDEQDLQVALHNQVSAFEATSGVACAISTGLQARLAPDLETALYRVAQETLNNVGKHAGASRVTVSLGSENGSVRLRINDDGIGFNPVAASRLLSEGHFGLAGMRERVEMVGGQLRIDSAPGQGTTIDVEMANHPAEQLST
jgi:two-component system NarL family sensor kinase